MKRRGTTFYSSCCYYYEDKMKMEGAVNIIGVMINPTDSTPAGLTYLEDLREEARAYLLTEEVVNTC